MNQPNPQLSIDLSGLLDDLDLDMDFEPEIGAAKIEALAKPQRKAKPHPKTCLCKACKAKPQAKPVPRPSPWTCVATQIIVAQQHCDCGAVYNLPGAKPHKVYRHKHKPDTTWSKESEWELVNPSIPVELRFHRLPQAKACPSCLGIDDSLQGEAQ